MLISCLSGWLPTAGCATTQPGSEHPAPVIEAETAEPVPPLEPGTSAEAAMPETEADAPDPNAPRVVPETWETVRRPEEVLDSVAVWPGAGARAWLLATARQTDRLLVFDAGTGEALREVGARGDGGGQFRRPNALAVVDDLAFVVERDNGRVQVLRLPGLSSLGFVGAGELTSPYALRLARSSEVPGAPSGEAASYELWVSDLDEAAGGPDRARRSRHYRVRAVADGLEVTPVAEDRRWESAEEAASSGAREEDLDDLFRGLVVAGDSHEAEGFALYACPDGSGYWLATEARDERSVFHVHDRRSLEALGSFTGEVTADTRGVWLSMVPTPEFPAGAFYAVSDAQSVTAFDWRHVADALGLRADCAMEGK